VLFDRAVYLFSYVANIILLFAGIVAFADRHNCTDLMTSSESFARHHFIEVVQGEEFMEISAKQLTRILSDDDLNIQSEERAFEAALAWIKYDVDVRQVQFSNVF